MAQFDLKQVEWLLHVAEGENLPLDLQRLTPEVFWRLRHRNLLQPVDGRYVVNFGKKGVDPVHYRVWCDQNNPWPQNFFARGTGLRQLDFPPALRQELDLLRARQIANREPWSGPIPTAVPSFA